MAAGVRDRRSVDGGATSDDGGGLTSTAPFVAHLENSPPLLLWVSELHDRGQRSCREHQGRPGHPITGDGCRELSEELWAETSDALRGFLDGAASLGQGARPNLLADVDCTLLDERSFGAALHIATLAPAWTSPAFLECAVQRTASSESFPLWAALDASSHLPESRTWLAPALVRDDRTLRRLSQTSRDIRGGTHE
jgi:hypothetical protein